MDWIILDETIFSCIVTQIQVRIKQMNDTFDIFSVFFFHFPKTEAQFQKVDISDGELP